MKVLVIGATGGTGAQVLPKALAAGHEVTAFARRPDAVTLKHEHLRVVKGDARDPASLQAAVAGQDGVISCFGVRSLKKDDLQETLMRNLIAAMKGAGVKRIISLSAWGVLDSAEYNTLLFKIFQATFLRNVWPDKECGERLLLESGLDYTNVRPGRLLNARARGGVKAALVPNGMKPEMTREDLAQFMVDQLAKDTWLRESPLIGY